MGENILKVKPLVTAIHISLTYIQFAIELKENDQGSML
jgi:hypothetical protein